MFLFTIFAICFENDNPLRLWYNLPSSKIPLNTKIYSNSTNFNSVNHNIWKQNTIPIGNGLIGASIFGEIQHEVIPFDELTLWEGGPSKSRLNYNGGNLIEKGQNGTVYRQIQQLFSEGKDAEATSMSSKMLVGEQNSKGSYIEFGENYIRYIDLDQSVCYVQYEYQSIKITREHFISHPDNVFVIHINGTKGSPLPNLNVSFDTNAKSTKTVLSKGSSIYVYGQLTDNQMTFSGKLTVVSQTAKIESNDSGKLIISGATDDIYIYISAATDYKNMHPKYRTGESIEVVNSRVSSVVNKAVIKGYEKVRSDHIYDFANLFSRVSLNLLQKPSSNPINVLLTNYKSGKTEVDQKRELEVLIFQFVRYITISSSREGGILPPNLQGIWNDQVEGVTWQSDYHLNVNLQMNFWPTFVTNLHECGVPLIDFVEGLKVPGRITAEIYCGVTNESGFFAHTVCTPFGRTAPGTLYLWGWSPSAILWLLQNVYDYYLFTGDKTTLRERIYPMMREEIKLFDQIMVYDKVHQRSS